MKQLININFLPLPHYPGLCLEETIIGIGKGENHREPDLRTMGDAVKPGSQENRGRLWSPLLCGVGSTTWSFRKLRAQIAWPWSTGSSKGPHGLVGWEDLIMNDISQPAQEVNSCFAENG